LKDYDELKSEILLQFELNGHFDLSIGEPSDIEIRVFLDVAAEGRADDVIEVGLDGLGPHVADFHDALFPGFLAEVVVKVGVVLIAALAVPDGAGPEGQGVPLSRIPEPSRTPLAWTTRNGFYKASDLTALKKASSLDNALLVDGKIPVLFVDGHVENLTPAEYVTRKLGEMPTK
jgi:prepilin-type processing-associated H-X9-DG protein